MTMLIVAVVVAFSGYFVPVAFAGEGDQVAMMDTANFPPIKPLPTELSGRWSLKPQPGQEMRGEISEGLKLSITEQTPVEGGVIRVRGTWTQYASYNKAKRNPFSCLEILGGKMEGTWDGKRLRFRAFDPYAPDCVKNWGFTLQQEGGKNFLEVTWENGNRNAYLNPS